MIHLNTAVYFSEIKAMLDLLGIYEIAPHIDFFTWVGHWLCNNEIHPALTHVCADLAWLIAGFNEDGKFNE